MLVYEQKYARTVQMILSYIRPIELRLHTVAEPIKQTFQKKKAL